MQDSKIKIAAVFILLSFIWGSTWLAIRLGLESLTPLFSAGVRFAIASFIIFIIIKIRKIKPATDKTALRLYFVMGFFSFVIPFGLVYWAEQYVPSGLASVLFAVYPFCVVIFSWLFLKSEIINFFKVAGILLGFAGIVVIFSDSLDDIFSAYFWGMAAVVFSGMMQAAIAVTIKKYGGYLNAFTINFIPMSIAAVSLILLGLIFEDVDSIRINAGGILSVLYLAVFGSIITFTSYYWLLKRVSVIILSMLAFITPVVALILGWLIFDEYLTERHLTGVVLVLSGLVTANILNFIKIFRKQT